MDYVLVALGFAFLLVGAEVLIRNAVRVAEKTGVSTFLIGLLLVSLGTSLPELVACIQAASIGLPALAIGNIVGSNIANILLILGATAIVAPIALPREILRRDGQFVLVCSLLFFFMAITMPLDHIVGAALLFILFCYMFYAHRQDKFSYISSGEEASIENLETPQTENSNAEHLGSIRGPIWWSLIGLIAVICGGNFLIDGASGVAHLWGVSDEVIGLTVLAIGTSLPELITSVLAAIRQQTQIALGNVLGSNIYNLLGIGGVTGLIAPSYVPQKILQFDIYVMIFSVVALLICALFARQFSRLMGVFFLMAYALYIYAL